MDEPVVSVTLYGSLTHTVEFAPANNLFDDSPTWVDITAYVRSGSCALTSRTNELDDFQPGWASLTLDDRDRRFDPAYGPASVTAATNPGAANYWSAGDLAAFNAAGELDLRACLSLPDWTPAGVRQIMTQYGAAGNRSWSWGINTDGYISLTTSTDGTTVVTATSGCRVSAVDAQTMCARATWTSAGVVYFYVKRTRPGRERADCLAHTGWTQLGAVKTGVVGLLFNSTASVDVGRRADATGGMIGTVYYADARTTIGSSTLVCAFWPADAASTAATSWTASAGAGETWTGNGTWTVAIQGPYFGRLTPGTPLRIRNTYSAVDYETWYGYVRRWPHSYPGAGTDAIARVEGLDALGWLLEQTSPVTPFGIAIDAANRETLIADPTAEIDPYWPLHEVYPATQFGPGNSAAGPGTFSGSVTAGALSQPGAPTVATRAFPRYGTAHAHTGDFPTGAGTFYSPALAFWCYIPDVSSTFEVIASGEDADGPSLSFVVNPGGRTYAQMDWGGVNQCSVTIPALTPGAHFVHVIWTAADTMAVYVDGVMVQVNAVSGVIRPTDGLYPPLWVAGTDIYSNATISDVTYGRVFDDVTVGYYYGQGRPLELSGPRMTWLLTAAGIPSSLQLVTTDVSTYLGPQPPNTTYGAHVKAVEAAENGRLYVSGAGVLTFRSHRWATEATAATTSQHTFGDGAGETPYIDLTVDPANIDDVVNSATVATSYGGAGVYTDETSAAMYGQRPVSRTVPLPSSAAATNLAIELATTRNHPSVRVENLTVTPLAPGWGATIWPQVLGRTIGERITVKRSPTATLNPATTTPAISAQLTIEGVQHTWDQQRWVTVWNTAPAPLTAQEACYFTADDAVLGVVDSGVIAAY